MKKRDIKYNSAKILNLKKKSSSSKDEYKNIVDLQSKKICKTKKVQDIKKKVSSDCFRETDIGNGGIKKILQSILPGRKFDLFQMGIIGISIVFILVSVNAFYKGKDLKDNILNNVQAGMSSILSAKDNIIQSDFKQAKNSFYLAIDEFNRAEKQIDFLKRDIAENYSKDTANKLIDGVIGSGNLLAEAGLDFTTAIENIKFLSSHTFENAEGKPSLTEGYKKNLELINQGRKKLSEAKLKIENIPDSFVPDEYKNLLDEAKNKISKAINIISKAEKESSIILTMLGDKLPQRYLVLFQNIDEKRPTGGFIGSFAILDINDGYITKFDIHDVYDFDGRFHDYIAPPQELAKLTNVWRLRDSNYSPDFAVSAAKAEWFLQKEGGPSADHVIAIDQKLLVEIVKATGDLKVEQIEKPISADDLNLLLSYTVESKISGETTPKKILKQIQPAVISKIKDPQNLAQIAPVLLKAVRQKHIQIWSKNPDVQDFLTRYNLAGRIYQSSSPQDYLNIIDINIGGNKSDKYISRKIDHTSIINSNGEIINNLKITKNHNFNDNQIDIWKSTLNKYGFTNFNEDVFSILGASDNESIEKIYIPAGSELINIEGNQASNNNSEVEIKYDNQIDKTYIMFPMKVLKGGESTVSITYKLPYKLNFDQFDNYIFYYQNQAANSAIFTKKIILDKELTAHKSYPDDLINNSDSQIIFNKQADQDFHLSILIGD